MLQTLPNTDKPIPAYAVKAFNIVPLFAAGFTATGIGYIFFKVSDEIPLAAISSFAFGITIMTVVSYHLAKAIRQTL